MISQHAVRQEQRPVEPCSGFVGVADISRKQTGTVHPPAWVLTGFTASGRLVDPKAIANLVLTLCLPLSRDINGAAITIDGGTAA